MLATVELDHGGTRSDLEKNGLVEGSGGLELALGGAIGGLVRGGATGALEWLGKGARNANWRSAARSPASVRE